MFFKKLKSMQAERYAAWRESQSWLVPAEDETKWMRREARQVHEMELSMARTGNYKTGEKMQALIDDYKRRASAANRDEDDDETAADDDADLTREATCVVCENSGPYDVRRYSPAFARKFYRLGVTVRQCRACETYLFIEEDGSSKVVPAREWPMIEEMTAQMTALLPEPPAEPW